MKQKRKSQSSFSLKKIQINDNPTIQTIQQTAIIATIPFLCSLKNSITTSLNYNNTKKSLRQLCVYL